MKTIDDYLKESANPSQKAVLERIRKLVHQLVPGVEEKVSYGIPTFTYNRTYLIYFAAFKNHMSIFPASDDMIKEIGDELGKFRTSKGTLQFTEDNPIPEPMIKEIIRHRLKSISKS